MSTHAATNPRWTIAVPPLGAVLLAATWHRDLPWPVLALVGVVLVAAVVTAVHHAEIVALRVGEPFGTLILAVAVTVIEVALILSVMVDGGDKAASLARDTAFAALMIICNGVVGICLVVGPLKHHTQDFGAEGASGALAVMTSMVTLSLVLPSFTSSSAGPTYTVPQLAFAGLASLVLYGVFVFVQTVRHRDYFLADPDSDAGAEVHADPPTTAVTRTSLAMLLLCLVAVVGLAKVVSPTIESGVEAIGAPVSSVGVVIAMLVLAPETLAAVRAASANRLQTSMNLAFGSALASIGLTIPVIAVASMVLDIDLELGLNAKDIVLLALTVVNTTLTLTFGRVTLLQGAVHLSVFAAFLFLAVSP